MLQENWTDTFHQLVAATKSMIERWNPSPKPQWITAVPSLNNVDLVREFSKRLSAALEIPYHSAISKLKKNEYQKKQENLYFQFKNLDGVFKVEENGERSLLFLVDDIVDSRATVTVIAALLRENGVRMFFLSLYQLAISKQDE